MLFASGAARKGKVCRFSYLRYKNGCSGRHLKKIFHHLRSWSAGRETSNCCPNPPHPYSRKYFCFFFTCTNTDPSLTDLKEVNSLMVEYHVAKRNAPSSFSSSFSSSPPGPSSFMTTASLPPLQAFKTKTTGVSRTVEKTERMVFTGTIVLSVQMMPFKRNIKLNKMNLAMLKDIRIYRSGNSQQIFWTFDDWFW